MSEISDIDGKTATDWYKTFFGEDYLSVFVPLLTPERTDYDVRGIIGALSLTPGNAILDLCCGHGRHAVLLAERGYQVTGLDFSEVFLDYARREAEAKGVTVRFVYSDMRAIPFENEFDAVINMFSAFGYLENEDEDFKVLQQVQRALKSGGKFLIETVSREGVIRHFNPSFVDHLKDGGMVIEERSFDLLASRNNVTMTKISPDGRKAEYRYSMRFYTLTELTHMLERAGLQLDGYYGSLYGRTLTMDSFRMVVVAHK
jgi:ubiquinone/menaquinone biosynthesis C-methylase UbiE